MSLMITSLKMNGLHVKRFVTNGSSDSLEFLMGDFFKSNPTKTIISMIYLESDSKLLVFY